MDGSCWQESPGRTFSKRLAETGNATKANMFTQCPKCDTVFRVTARELQIARGDVRCGNCAKTFDALESLTDAPPHSSELDDEFDPEPSGPGIQQGFEGDDSATQDQPTGQTEESLEFDVPEQKWASFFMDAEPSPGQPPGITDDNQDTSESDAWSGQAFKISDDADEAAFSQPEFADAASADGTKNAAPQVKESDAPPWLGRPSTPASTPGPRQYGIGWWIAAGFLCVTLFSQFIHYNRDMLAASMRYGAAMQSFYDRLNAPLYPAWQLDAYKVRGSEIIGGADSALEIMAKIEITGEQTVGFPLIRVSLRDRWSNPVAGKIFSPAEYLTDGEPSVDKLSPGQVIAVQINVEDPGSEAQGYELDVCMPRRHSGLECQSDKDPFRQ
jgi:predicted Zn finger-like uncharacterized protein